jgi:uncharacterized NAD(P)/FAD-binding protein YdhS
MLTVGIIGAGFCGIMTAVHLINSRQPVRIIIINDRHPFARGIAFSPYSQHHILNVPAGKMSAFPDRPAHFVDWIQSHKYFDGLTDTTLIAGSYLPRQLYGDYLEDIWRNALASRADHTEVTVIDDTAIRVEANLTGYRIHTAKSGAVGADEIVLATGNSLPARPAGITDDILNSGLYFEDPWSVKSISVQAGNPHPVLIIGNGLTMVDTVLGLVERGYMGKIYSVSPNGFSILSHQGGAPYTGLESDVRDMGSRYALIDIVSIFQKHERLVRKLGLSAEPVVDALRPWTQKIWAGLSLADRALFLSRIRHLWGAARHRLPIHQHDKIQSLRIDGSLVVIAGKVTSSSRGPNGIQLTYFDKRLKRNCDLTVSRIINCTGPATKVEEGDNQLLIDMQQQGLIKQDAVTLGLDAHPESFQVYDRDGVLKPDIFALGNLLKGVLWETTAVPELRQQALKVAMQIVTSSEREKEPIDG